MGLSSPILLHWARERITGARGGSFLLSARFIYVIGPALAIKPVDAQEAGAVEPTEEEIVEAARATRDAPYDERCGAA